jgi:hypothetical protein
MAARTSKTGSDAEPKWERTPREIEAVKKVVTARMEGVPRLHVSKSEKGLSITTEHRDDFAGKSLLMEAIATTDVDFLAGFVNQLAEASGGEVDEQQLNFMLAVVKGIKPRDQMEAMLAAQMAAVHTATMKFSRNLAEAELVEHRDSAERTLNKLMRTFVTQMEALKALPDGRRTDCYGAAGECRRGRTGYRRQRYTRPTRRPKSDAFSTVGPCPRHHAADAHH